jgi:perosamine synthetase
MNNKLIPVFDGEYVSNEENYLIDAVRSGIISSQGKYVNKFEEGFSKYLNCDYGITVANGTVALETAYFSIGIQEGDEIIMPSFTIISCAIGAIRLGAIPVFVDVGSKTWCIDVEKIESKITCKTKAILAVHMYGHPCDMDPILLLAKKHNLIVIEDASQVHGGEYKGLKCGSIGDISTFSFYANKIISTGEGGMVVTSNKNYANRSRDFRNLCFLPNRRFYHQDLGNNYRMGNLQAAVGLAQLEILEKSVETKIKNGLIYKNLLSKINHVQTQTELKYAKMVYWMYCIVLSDQLNFDAIDVSTLLKERYSIITRPFFTGLHEQPILKQYFKKNGHNQVLNDLKVTERISKKGLYLPSGFNLETEDIEYICKSLDKTIKHLKKFHD